MVFEIPMVEYHQENPKNDMKKYFGKNIKMCRFGFGFGSVLFKPKANQKFGSVKPTGS